MSGEVTLRYDIPGKLTERRQYRRGRRNKLRYRKPRFDNRKRTEKLSPSIRQKLQTFVELVGGIKRTCAYCGRSEVPLQVEHIIPSSRGGSDRVSNLTIACSECNQKKGDKTAEEFGHPEVQEQAKESLKAAAFMNTIRWELVRLLDCSHTYGYITKHNRIKLNLEKSHVNDAFVIAGGIDQARTRPYQGKQTRRNSRALQTNRNGFKPSIRKKKYGLGSGDLVFLKLGSVICTVKGVFNYGKWVRVVDSIGNIVNANIKHVELIKYGKGLQLRFA